MILSLDVRVPYLNKDRFLVTYAEVLMVEELLIKNKGLLESKEHSEKDYCPDLRKNLDKYLRQYIAYHENGKRVLLINAFWAKDTDVFPHWHNKYVTALDGCTYFWRARFDLDKQTFIEIDFNAEN